MDSIQLACGCRLTFDEDYGVTASVRSSCPEHGIALEPLPPMSLSLGWTLPDEEAEPLPAPTWTRSFRWSCPRPGG